MAQEQATVAPPVRVMAKIGGASMVVGLVRVSRMPCRMPMERSSR